MNPNSPIPIGPPFGCRWPLPVGETAKNSPSLVSSTIASISMWLGQVEIERFFSRPHQVGWAPPERPSS